MKKTFLLCFAAALLLSSCGAAQTTEIGETDADPVSETVVTEDTSLKPDLPELDYNGAEFRIFHNDCGGNNFDVVSDGLNGELLNDIVFQRNLDTEERFNIHLVPNIQTGDTLGDTVIRAITAGDDSCEMILTAGISLTKLISMNLTHDLTDSMPYMDLSKPWWSQDFQNNTKINGKLYAITGDISHIALESLQFLTFNRNLFYANDLEAPYQAVRDGTWTFDKFQSLIKDYSGDLDGDGKISLANDRFGYLIHESIMPASYVYTNDVHICEYQDGVPYLNLDVEKITDVSKAYRELVNSNLVSDAVFGTDGCAAFLADRILFMDCTMRTVRSHFREMKSDFGLVPFPKFDESVPRYTVIVGREANITAVPVTTEKTEMISAVLEYMAYYGYTYITPIYYDTILGDKLMRDQDSRDMMEILRESMYFDFGNWCGLQSLQFNSLINSKSEPASYIASNQAKMEKELSKFLESVS